MSVGWREVERQPTRILGFWLVVYRCTGCGRKAVGNDSAKPTACVFCAPAAPPMRAGRRRR